MDYWITELLSCVISSISTTKFYLHDILLEVQQNCCLELRIWKFLFFVGAQFSLLYSTVPECSTLLQLKGGIKCGDEKEEGVYGIEWNTKLSH